MIEGDLVDFVRIRDLKEQPGGDIGIHASISVAQALLAAGVVDELSVSIAPMIVGRGRRLLDGSPSLQLEMIRSEISPTGYLLIDYRVIRWAVATGACVVAPLVLQLAHLLEARPDAGERAPVGERDEHRVVARDRAHDLRPARAVERRRERVRRPGSVRRISRVPASRISTGMSRSSVRIRSSPLVSASRRRGGIA